MPAEAIVRTPDELTGAWLGAVLGRDDVTITTIDEIGTGQMSQSHRVTFAAAGGAPETVVVKLASADANSRATGVGMGAYWREVIFYRGLAERNFERRFQLADYVVVTEANLADGLLSIALKRELPEALKPRRIEIGVGKPTLIEGEKAA